MQIHLSALGCRLNEAELELWAGEFRNHGHQLVTDAADADLMVLNTCAVTQEAVRKSRKSITRLQRHNPLAKMIVSGCFVSLDDTQSAADLGVDLIVANDQKEQLVSQAHELLDLTAMPVGALEPDMPALFARQRQRAFIKIQDGCRYRCTFCVVTLARGEERSRPLDDVINEVNQLVQQGVQEIVLTGVHVGGYGSDIDSSLYELVASLIDNTDVPRIRFASVEPWDLPDSFLQLFENPRLMPHMHLPLQSGSDTVLRRMARRCKTEDYTRLLQNLRGAIPGFNVTTDIIVGFPGETEEEWQQTINYIAETGFGHIHIFSYSPRQGTKAANLPGQLTGDIKKARSRQLHLLAAELKTESMKKLIGSTQNVLWENSKETADNQHHVFGYTPNYFRVSALLQSQSETEKLENTITSVSINSVIPEPLAANKGKHKQTPVLEGGLQHPA